MSHKSFAGYRWIPRCCILVRAPAGSVGAALLHRLSSPAAVTWLRDMHTPRTYSPGSSGVYPLVHALHAGEAVTVFTAREGAKVEPRPGGKAGIDLPPQSVAGGPALVGLHFYHKYYPAWKALGGKEPGGPGTLNAPLRVEEGESCFGQRSLFHARADTQTDTGL